MKIAEIQILLKPFIARSRRQWLSESKKKKTNLVSTIQEQRVLVGLSEAVNDGLVSRCATVTMARGDVFAVTANTHGVGRVDARVNVVGVDHCQIQPFVIPTRLRQS